MNPTGPTAGLDQIELLERPQRRSFGTAFWPLCVIELFERLAYFGIRSVVPIYIMQATEPGGLHLTATHKGLIYAWWAFFQSFLPIVTGGFADRYGYKRVLALAVSANVVGYVMMAFFHSYAGFFAGILVLAVGTAFFKPSLQGSLAQNLTKENSSVGWGIFYWVVNVGGFAAPFASTLVLGQPHSAEGWRNLFLICAGFTLINLLVLPTFRDVPSGSNKTDNPFEVLIKTIVNVFDSRLIAFLLIMSCFWMMMYQLWDLHPNFIEDWVDSSAIAAYMPFESWTEYGDRGIIRVPQQILLNLNGGLILLLVLPISWLVRRMRTLSAMLIGMTVATGGILVAGLTGNGWVLLLGIVFFSLGEMLTGPKKNEYLGLIAPSGKKGLYLGYVNIPVGIGVGLGSWMAGHTYDRFGEKASLALRHMGAHPVLIAGAAPSVDWSDSLEKLPAVLNVERDQAFETVTQQLGGDAESAGALLRAAYRHDEGQITNLAMLYLATLPEFRGKAAARRSELQVQAPVAAGQSATSPAAEPDGLGRHVHLLPKWLGVKRAEAMERLRYELKQSTPDAAIVEMLWQHFGSDDDVLDNLALEYLAQATDRLSRAVPGLQMSDPVADMEDRLGLGRTKSFAALASAMGATSFEIDRALSAVGAPSAPVDMRPFVYLIERPQFRFNAVARKDWTKDVDLLRAMIEPDDSAKSAVMDSMPAGIDYSALAEDAHLIQLALARKDWPRQPDHAAQLLGMSPFETRALVACDVNGSRITATRLLWDLYHPQYYVWIPFAAIGVIAAIALAIFGQRAKRWADMNA